LHFIINCRIKDALKNVEATRKYNDAKLKKDCAVAEFSDEARTV